jgi:hypothetical protein
MKLSLYFRLPLVSFPFIFSFFFEIAAYVSYNISRSIFDLSPCGESILCPSIMLQWRGVCEAVANLSPDDLGLASIALSSLRPLLPVQFAAVKISKLLVYGLKSRLAIALFLFLLRNSIQETCLAHAYSSGSAEFRFLGGPVT